MAKAKKIRLSIKGPKAVSLDTSPGTGPDDKEWQTRSDANTIKDYAQLKSKPDRHKAAMGHIQNEQDALNSVMGGVGDAGEGGDTDSDSDEDDDSGIVEPRVLARQGRKASVRTARRSGRG